MYRDFNLIDTVISWVYWGPSIAIILAIYFGLSKLAKYDPTKDKTPRLGEIISYVLGVLSAIYAAYWVFGGLFVKGYEVPGITRRVLVTLVLSIGFGYAAYFSNILPSPVSFWTKCGKVVAHILCWVGLATIPFRLIDGSLFMMTVANFLGYILLPVIGLALGLYLYRKKKTPSTAGNEQ